jgi:hypothetical protein
MKRSTRKQKSSPPKDEAIQRAKDEKKLKVDTLKVDTLIKELPIDLQGEILEYLRAAYEVRKGKLLRKTLRMSGKIQEKLLNSMPQIMRGKKRIQLNLKTPPMEIRNRMENNKSWYKFFDHPKLLGERSLAVVEDSNGNPSYRYISKIDGLDSVEINTPINNDTVLEPFVKRDYPSYPFTQKKLGKNQTIKAKFNPTIPNTQYNPPRRAYIQ